MGRLRQPLIDNLKKGVDVLIDIDTQGAGAIRNCGDPFVRESLA
jgi:guanylate kinase